MIERRRSPFRRPPVGDVALLGLCTVPDCWDVWLIETDHGRLCRAHHAALAVQVAPSSPPVSAAPACGEGGASREAGAMTAAIEATPGGQSLLWSRRLPSPA